MAQQEGNGWVVVVKMVIFVADPMEAGHESQ